MVRYGATIALVGALIVYLWHDTPEGILVGLGALTVIIGIVMVAAGLGLEVWRIGQAMGRGIQKIQQIVSKVF